MSTNTISIEILQALEDIKKTSQQNPCGPVEISNQELEVLFLASLLEEE